MRACIHLDPNERPKIGEVCEWLWNIPYHWSNEGVPVAELHRLIDDVGELLPSVRYNKRILRLLQSQMKSMKGLQDVPLEKSRVAWSDLKAGLESGKALIEEHIRAFDICNFYTVDELKLLVEDLCNQLHDATGTLDAQDGINIDSFVPEWDILRDREDLEACLRFVVLGEQFASVEHGWIDVKTGHETGMLDVGALREDDILPALRGAKRIATGNRSYLYEVEWRGSMVAVKQLKGDAVEDLVRLSIEATFGAFPDNKHIIKVHALCMPGRLLAMELASGNLKDWYKTHPRVSWETKIVMLHQASLNLAHLHGRDERPIHRDVRTSNFLVCGGPQQELPLVKLGGLGTATPQNTGVKIAVKMQPEAILYCAPEIHRWEPHSQSSDVFSFGVVMCELAAQRTPTWGVKGGNSVSAERKESGELPCRLPTDCPQPLRDLINLCLSAKPSRQPSMKDVEGRLAICCESLCKPGTEN
ncbi:unnamed protein product [Ostreobium quekettii]|uniref:Protein kinase domain-containing protein n=1 Tax=Ostreobium quekettii TaxID=121088 RepID=A0A8S1IYL7_9CHLO|nr:unnamed protein product [Ostreobium quekettii]